LSYRRRLGNRLHRRRRIALALCVLWLAGFELLPWLHVATHDRIAAHYHDANGATIYVASEAELPAGAHVHTHVYPRLPEGHARHKPDYSVARLAAALAHGDHNLAHHGIAAPVPPPAWLTPLPIDRKPITLAREFALAPLSLDPLAAVARGPPASSSTI
jgi:hypothetical protein